MKIIPIPLAFSVVFVCAVLGVAIVMTIVTVRWKESPQLQDETGGGTLTWTKVPSPTEMEVTEFEPVSTLGYGPPSFIFSQSAVLTADPCYITKADAKEIVVALESLKGYWHIETAINGSEWTVTARPDPEEQRIVTTLRDKWRKRLEEMK